MAETEEVDYVPLLSAPESDGEEEEPPPVSVHSVPENGGKPSSPRLLWSHKPKLVFLRPVEFLLNAIPPPGRWKMESCR